MRVWIARLLVLAVFAVNVYCALTFILFPAQSVGAYELAGVSGTAAIQGIGVAFLMWNVTYPLVIINPAKYRTIFILVIIQQIVGLIGESYILYLVPEGHQVLVESITRFIIFDAAGLLLLVLAFLLARRK